MEDKYKIPYINACIRAFAKRFDLSAKAAYEYLDQYKGLDFLVEFYETEHLQSIDDAVDDLIVCCQNNGGYLKQQSILAKGREKTMEITTLLEYSERSQLRAWLQENHSREKECWVVISRSKTPPPGILPYIDVVEEALCFGWIDSTLKKLPDGRLAQRLSPRRPQSHWTKLNMERCMDLEDRGLMTPVGRRAFEKIALQGLEWEKH